jgi:hypothetical protein
MFGQKSPFFINPSLPPEYGAQLQQPRGGFGSVGGALQGANNPGALRAQYQAAQGDLGMADKLLEAGYVPNSGAMGALAMIASAYAGRKIKKGAEEKMSDAVSKMFEMDTQKEKEMAAAEQAQKEQEYTQRLAQLREQEAIKAEYRGAAKQKDYKVGNEIVRIGEDGQPQVVYAGKRSGGGGPAPLASQREFELYKSMSPEDRALYNEVKGRNKKGMVVYDPNTGQPIMEMGGGGSELAKPVQNKIQGEILDAENSIANLEATSDKFSKDYLTIGGRVKAKAGQLLDKAGLPDIGGAKEFNSKRAVLIQDIDQFFNEYKKYITGAAAAAKEIEDLKKASLDSSLGPDEFMARYNNLLSRMRSEVDRKKQSLQTGITPVGGGQAPSRTGAAKQNTALNRDDLLKQYMD